MKEMNIFKKLTSMIVNHFKVKEVDFTLTTLEMIPEKRANTLTTWIKNKELIFKQKRISEYFIEDWTDLYYLICSPDVNHSIRIIKVEKQGSTFYIYWELADKPSNKIFKDGNITKGYELIFLKDIKNLTWHTTYNYELKEVKGNSLNLP
jgi:hypothetical protein